MNVRWVIFDPVSNQEYQFENSARMIEALANDFTPTAENPVSVWLEPKD